MRGQPKVTIIILNFNGIDETRDCLKSLYKTEYINFQVIIADNGSKINEAEILRKEFNNKKLRFVRFNKNLGFSGGNNKIIKQIMSDKKNKTEYVLVLNNDTIVDRNWIKELIKVAEADENIAAVAAKIKSFYNPEYFDPSGAGGYLDKLGYPYTRGRIGFSVEKDQGQYDTVEDLFWGAGTCLLIRSEPLKKSGLLPESFFFYHEETDLCWRLKNSGYRIVSAPLAVVYHKGAVSSVRDIPNRIFFVHRNNLLLLARNLSFKRLIWVMPLRFIADFITGIYYLITLRPMFFTSLVKAEMSFVFLLPSVLLERMNNKNKFFAENEMKPLSILWKYSINNVKRYSELSGNFTNIQIKSSYYISQSDSTANNEK
ncbi:MAG: glycosyltransferase family 2 protein [Candidatus Levybacteria bacterium]|nr:glycosyltransferase family 2 protein [Candidatus Levybacteria bacterium]